MIFYLYTWLISSIEEAKFNILNDFYSLFPTQFFTHKTPLPQGPPFQSLCTSFCKLEKCISSAHQQWKCFFLEKYLLHKTTPRVLRILKQCSFSEPDLINEWEYMYQISVLVNGLRSLSNKEKGNMTPLLSKSTLCKGITQSIKHLPNIWLRTLKRNTIKKM